MAAIAARLGSVRYVVEVKHVNHRKYREDADDIRDHTVELTIDLDGLLDRLAARACRSTRGRSTGMHGAIIAKRKA